MAVERKPEEIKPGAPEYMNTYGDLVTLLLCFFVLLFAMSTVDAAKFQAMAASFVGNPISSSMGGKESVKDLYGSGIMEMPALQKKSNASSPERNEEDDITEAVKEDVAQMSSDFKTYFAEQNVADVVQVDEKDIAIVITLKEGLLFDSGRANLKPEAIPILEIIGEELKGLQDRDIQVEGHTDTDPINTPQFPSNWYLSGARAMAVGTYLIDTFGFDPVRFGMLGKGEYVPVAPNDTPENKAKNRRVEIRIQSIYYSE